MYILSLYINTIVYIYIYFGVSSIQIFANSFFEAGEMIRNNKQNSLLSKNCVAVCKTLKVSISDSRFLSIPVSLFSSISCTHLRPSSGISCWRHKLPV